MPSKNTVMQAARLVFTAAVGLFCVTLVVLALLYINTLLQNAPSQVRVAVWSLTGTGLFILAAACLYLKGRQDASRDMSERVQELKEHILELQRFNQEMEKRMHHMEEARSHQKGPAEPSRETYKIAGPVFVPGAAGPVSPKTASAETEKGRKPSWLIPWKNRK